MRAAAAWLICLRLYANVPSALTSISVPKRVAGYTVRKTACDPTRPPVFQLSGVRVCTRTSVNGGNLREDREVMLRRLAGSKFIKG